MKYTVYYALHGKIEVEADYKREAAETVTDTVTTKELTDGLPKIEFIEIELVLEGGD